ncbi:MAG: hypothetical protein ACOYK6_05450 [Chthoniobacterales bacterium]
MNTSQQKPESSFLSAESKEKIQQIFLDIEKAEASSPQTVGATSDQQAPSLLEIEADFKKAIKTIASLEPMKNKLQRSNPDLAQKIDLFSHTLQEGIQEVRNAITSIEPFSWQKIEKGAAYQQGRAKLALGFNQFTDFWEEAERQLSQAKTS